MTVITKGVVWVVAQASVEKDEQVCLQTSENAGDFSNSGGVEIDGAKFLTSGDAGELVKISLGMGG
jgi:hypothetical protein